MKVKVIIENKQGQVLGQAVTSKDRITIGRDSLCTLSLSDDKTAPQENEIYLLNGECWLQVSKDGAPVTLKGKQYRTIKIEESSTLFFRQFTLKIVLEASQDKQNDATRVVDSNDVKTRIEQNEESTRIVEKTEEFMGRVDLGEEKTRVLSIADEKTRVVDDLDFKPNIKPITKSVSSYEKQEEAMSFGFEQEAESADYRNAERFDQWSKSFAQLNFKDIGLTALATLVCLFVGKWLFFSGSPQDLSLESIASEQAKKLDKIVLKNSEIRQGNQRQEPVDKSIQSVTREEYIRSLSSFFDKH